MARSAGVFLLLLGGVLSAPGCDKTTGVAPIKDGLAECLSLRDRCALPALELGGRYRECHGVGRDDDGSACLRVYEECSALCEGAPVGMGGAGGEGGGAAGSG